MNSIPLVSVVMSVYNGADTLEKSIVSILRQKDVDFEFIVVNDGSTDTTLDILSRFAASDDRLKILNQKNKGLTRSLIRGCAKARGGYIARQDAGDLSFPGRLQKQADCLSCNAQVALVSCGILYVDERDEFLYDRLLSKKEISQGLQLQNSSKIKGPFHGCVMFRNEQYKKVGGYRKEFDVSQDLDLWMRFMEVGDHYQVSELLYQVALLQNSISNLKRDLQMVSTKLILECARRRRSGLSEEPVLEKAAGLAARRKKTMRWLSSANWAYYLARVSHANNPETACHYYKQAIGHNPVHLKAILKLVQLKLEARRWPL